MSAHLGLSAHLQAELDAIEAHGPLELDGPVPGCSCWICTGIMPAPLSAPDLGGITCPRCHQYRELARTADVLRYACPECRTVSAAAFAWTAAGSDLRDLPFLPEGVRRRPPERAPLDLERARAVPIRRVAEQYGMRVNRAGYARCLWHEDRHPSMQVGGKRNIVHCYACGKSADTIELVQQVRGCGFLDALRELA